MKENDLISFTYKGGREVKLQVTGVTKNSVVGILRSDYIGKNVEWFTGEKKDFNLAEMKDIIIQPKQDREEVKPTDAEVWEWFRSQKFQTDQGEQEYTMIYELDLPKIIRAFINQNPPETESQEELLADLIRHYDPSDQAIERVLSKFIIHKK